MRRHHLVPPTLGSQALLQSGRQVFLTYVNIGNLLPIVAVQPVPQQHFLWELAKAEGKDLAPHSARGSPWDPGSSSLLDVPNLLFGFLNLLLQGLPFQLAGGSALFFV